MRGEVTIPQFRDRLETYLDITAAILRQHHLDELLAPVAPVAEQFGLSLPLGAKPRLRLSADGGDARLGWIAS